MLMTAGAPFMSLAQEKARVGLIEFSARGSADPAEAKALIDRIGDFLVKQGKANVLIPDRVNAMLRDQGFQNPANCDIACLVRAGKILQADKMLTGTFGKVGSRVNLALQIIDVRTAKIDGFKPILIKGSVKEYFDENLEEVAEWIQNNVAVPSGGMGATARESDSLSVGAMAPDFILQDVATNKYVKLREYAGKGAKTGHVVILNFWATWCRPCEIEIPYLVKLAKEFNGKPVKVLLIETMDIVKPDEIQRLMKERGYTLTSLIDDEGVAARKWYKIRSLPYTFVIDKSGTIRRISHGYHEDFQQELAAFVKELLAEGG